MVSLVKSKWPTARKLHTCDSCGEMIKQGETYHLASGFFTDEDSAFVSVYDKHCDSCVLPNLCSDLHDLALWSCRFGAEVKSKTIEGGTRDESVGLRVSVKLDGDTFVLEWARDENPNREKFIKWLSSRPSITSLPDCIKETA